MSVREYLASLINLCFMQRLFQLTVWHLCRIVNFLEPQVLTLLAGVRSIAWSLRHPFQGNVRRVWASVLRPVPPKKRPCAPLIRLMERLTNTSLISHFFELRLFNRLSGIRVGWLIFSSLWGPSPLVLTLMGGVRFITRRLRRRSFECRRGPRHFWDCRTRVGFGPAPGPT